LPQKLLETKISQDRII